MRNFSSGLEGSDFETMPAVIAYLLNDPSAPADEGDLANYAIRTFWWIISQDVPGGANERYYADQIDNIFSFDYDNLDEFVSHLGFRMKEPRKLPRSS